MDARWLLLLALVIAVELPLPALAQGDDVAQGKALIADGKVKEGIEKLEMAYMFDQTVELAQTLAEAYDDMGHFTKALHYWKKVRDGSPDKALVKKAEARIKVCDDAWFEVDGLIEKASKDPANAPTHWQAIVTKYPEYWQAPSLLLNAAERLTEQGKRAEACKVLAKCVDKYPKADLRGKIILDAITCFGETGGIVDQEKLLALYISEFNDNVGTKPKVLEAHVLLARIYAKQAKETTKKGKASGFAAKAEKHYQEVLAIFDQYFKPKTDEATYAAEAAFQLLEKPFQAYQVLVEPVAKVAMRESRIKALDSQGHELTKGYKAIIEYGDAGWAAAATCRLAGIAHAKYLFYSQVQKPPTMDDVDWKIASEPFELKAQEYLQAARYDYKQVGELYGQADGAAPWIDEATKALTTLPEID